MPIFLSMGFKRTLLAVGGLMLAAGGPITLYSTKDVADGVKRSWATSSGGTVAASPQQPSSSPTAPGAPPEAAGLPRATHDAMPTPSLSEVLRFDVTVEWVMQRWPRISTGLPYLQLQGYRVPLVTGGRIADVAGSLTYYFCPQQRVQRITLRGTTGDPSGLVAILASRYGFARRLTNDPGLVLYEAVNSGNQQAGTLKIRSANVIKANQLHTRFDIDLVMDRPGS